MNGKAMFLLGMTGPTGVGKSYAANVFAGEGFAVVNADATARAVVAPGSETLARLAQAFGADILQKDGTLDRTLLAARAFASPETTRRLNRITHPAILRRMESELDVLQKKGAAAVLLDAPALLESGADRFCDKVLAIVADDPALCLTRIMRRDGLTEAEARRRMRAQQEPSFYTRKADFVLVNRGDSIAFVREIQTLIERMRAEGLVPASGAAEHPS